MRKVEFFRHDLREEDIGAAAETMRSLFLTTGPQVERFEEVFARCLDAPAAVGLTSCTGAIHLALLRCGVGPGDEVVTTPMTFAATAAAVVEAGARPVFADVCPRSGLLLPEAAARAVTPRTRALLPVHLYGRMADMRGFAEVAKRHGLALIEDAAHCIEGVRDGCRPGELSDAACFSFYATKGMTCGEGGALVCPSKEDAEWYRAARHHGISRSAVRRHGKAYEPWDMEMMGWKYNMSDIQAALLIGQVGRLDENRSRRESLESLYRERLSALRGVDLMEPPGAGEIHAHHMCIVLLPEELTDSKYEIMGVLQERGVGCAENYRAVHTLQYFREEHGFLPGDFPVALGIGRRTVTLPLYPGLTGEEVHYVCDTLETVLEEFGK